VDDEEVDNDNYEKENIVPAGIEVPVTMPHLIQFGVMKKLDEINLADTGSKIQIWEQSMDTENSSSSTAAEWKPVLVTAVEDIGDVPSLSPPPSFADNEYESSSSIESDIDILNDNEDELGLNDDRDSIMSLSISSIISQSSSLSQLRDQYLKAHLSKQANRRGFNFKYSTPKRSAISDDDESSPSQSLVALTCMR